MAAWSPPPIIWRPKPGGGSFRMADPGFTDGGGALVAFSPRSAAEALIGGLAAAQHAAAESEFAGVLQVVAPDADGARRVLALGAHRAEPADSMAGALVPADLGLTIARRG